MIASRWLHYGVNEFLWAFVKQQIMSFFFPNFVIEILPTPTYDLGSTDRTMILDLISHRCGPGFEPGSGHVGFCGEQSGAGAGFLRVLRFPLPIFIPPIAPKIIRIYHLGFVQ
jgi:hypothetical protein